MQERSLVPDGTSSENPHEEEDEDPDKDDDTDEDEEGDEDEYDPDEDDDEDEEYDEDADMQMKTLMSMKMKIIRRFLRIINDGQVCAAPGSCPPLEKLPRGRSVPVRGSRGAAMRFKCR